MSSTMGVYNIPFRMKILVKFKFSIFLVVYALNSNPTARNKILINLLIIPVHVASN